MKTQGKKVFYHKKEKLTLKFLLPEKWFRVFSCKEKTLSFQQKNPKNKWGFFPMWGTVRLQTSTLALWQNISCRSLSLNSHKSWTRGFPGQSGKKLSVIIPVLVTAVNSFSSFVFSFRPAIVQREMVYWRKRIYQCYSKPSNIKLRQKETLKPKKNISNNNTEGN